MTSRVLGLPGVLRLIDLAIEILLAALLLFLPAALGTVDAWSERIGMLIGGAIAALVALRIALDPPRIAAPPAMIVVLFLALAALQLIPLPRGMIETLSPATAQTKVDLLGDLPDAGSALDRMTLSFYPLAGRHDLRIVLLACIVLAAVVVVFRDNPRRTRRLLATIAAIGAATALLALAQDITGTTQIYWTREIGFAALSGPFVNHSHFGQFMNLAIGAALGLMLVRLNDDAGGSPRRWLGVALLGGTIVLGLLTVCLSLTRGGVIAMAAAGLVALLVLLSRRTLRWFGAVLIALALLVLVALLYYGFNRVYERMADSRGLHGRLQMVQDTRAIIRRFPQTGTGLGSFEWVYPAYNHTNEANTASHVENEYVQSAAEMGICGLVLVLLFVAMVWRRYARAIRAGGIGVAAIGLGYGLAAVMVHSLTDFGQHLPSVACLSAAVCGLILNLGAAPTRSMPRVGAVTAAVILIATAAWMVVDAESAHRGEAQWRIARRMARQMERREWTGTPQEFADLLAAADAAVAAEPDHAHRRYWAAYYHWRDVVRQRDPQTREIPKNDRTIAQAERVVDMLNEARKRGPTDAAIYSVLGQVEYNFLGRAIGITHIHAAGRLDLSDPTAWYVAGEVDARRGKDDAAATELRRAVDLDASVIDDVNSLAIEELGRPQLAVRVAQTDWHRTMQVADALGKLPQYKDQARPLYERAFDMLAARCRQPDAQGWEFATLGFYRRSQGRYEEAEKYLATAIQLDSSDLGWRLEHARTLADMGRFEEAIREVRTAQRMYPASPEAKKTLESLTETKR